MDEKKIEDIKVEEDQVEQVEVEEVKEDTVEVKEDTTEVKEVEITSEEGTQIVDAPIVDQTEEEKILYEKAITVETKEEMVQQIVKNQTDFTAAFKKNKRINLIIMFAFMAAMLGCFFALSALGGGYIAIVLVLIVVYFVVLSVYSKKTKKKLNDDADRLLHDYFALVDSYITKDAYFTDIEMNQKEKLPVDLIKELRVVKDIQHIGGRDKIQGKIGDIPFVAGDAIVKTREKQEDGRMQDFIVFLGKLFIIEKPNLIQDGRVIIYLKGKGANGPTDTEGLERIEGVLSEKYALYASGNYEALFTDKIKELLDGYEINEDLIDLFITIDEKRVSFGFSYSDAVMSVPLFDPLKEAALDQYIKDAERMVSIFKELNQ